MTIQYEYKNHEFGSHKDFAGTYPCIDYRAYYKSLPLGQKRAVILEDLNYKFCKILLGCLLPTVLRAARKFGLSFVFFSIRKLIRYTRFNFLLNTSLRPFQKLADYNLLISSKYREVSVPSPSRADYGWILMNLLATPYVRQLTENAGLKIASKQQWMDALPHRSLTTEDLASCFRNGQIIICQCDHHSDYCAYLFKDERSDEVELFALSINGEFIAEAAPFGEWARLRIIAELSSEISRYHFNTHFVCEVFLVSCYRKLPARHFIRNFLSQFDQLSFSAMERAKTTVKNDTLMYTAFIDKPLDHAMACYHSDGLRKLISKSAAGKENIAGPYPYRDDRIALEEILSEFARSWISHHYPDESSFRNDEDLQAWIKDMANAGRIVEFPQTGRLHNREELVDVLTLYLVLVTLLHFGTGHERRLNAIATDIQNYPAFLHPEKPKSPPNEEELLRLYPGLDRSFNLFFLTNAFYVPAPKTLLDLEASSDDPPMGKLVEKLQSFEREIQTRNRGRRFPLETMLPSEIPLGIHD